MKRISGVVMLLASLSGCISFTAGPSQGEKKTTQNKSTQVSALPPGGLALSSPPPLSMPGTSIPLPTNAVWTPNPAHLNAQTPPRLPADSVVARQTQTPLVPPVSPMTSRPDPVPPATNPASTPPSPEESVAVAQAVAATMAPGTPATTVPINKMSPPPLPLPAGMPAAYTPRAQQPPELPGGIIQQAVSVEPMVNGKKVEALKPFTTPATKITPPAPPVPDLPTPVVKDSKGVEHKQKKVGAPLVRLVNTKRITLNFEVKDVGPSGVSSVELWYTQDGKVWKKYDAPTNAQAYVVEVDEEGMYGFTLLARSGLGLGGEPPASGDQPQVWVIVDLSKPDVKLLEATPTLNTPVQSVTFRWAASDKNLGRNPITLYYSEHEEGPWKVIAGNLQNTGKYVWEVPGTPPATFFAKVEATDLAGNVGEAKSQRAIPLDNSKPKVSIINVTGTPIN